MSVPADTPAEVHTVPSRTKRCSCTCTSPSSRSAFSTDQCVVALTARQQPGRMKHEGTAAHRHQHLAMSGLGAHEVQQHRVVHLLPRALAAGHEQCVQRRTGGEVAVRKHPHAFGALHRPGGLRHQQAFRRAVGIQAPHAQHLPGPDEVELLGAREQQDAETSWSHCRRFAWTVVIIVAGQASRSGCPGRPAGPRSRRGVSFSGTRMRSPSACSRFSSSSE